MYKQRKMGMRNIFELGIILSKRQPTEQNNLTYRSNTKVKVHSKKLIKKPRRYHRVFSYLAQFSISDFIAFWTDDRINLLCCSSHSNMTENNLFL